MAIDILLDDLTGDIKLDQNQRAQLTPDLQASAKQQCQIRLRCNLGEWAFNIAGIGIPYIANDNSPTQLLGAGDNRALIDGFLKTEIEQVENVIEILEYSSQFDKQSSVMDVDFIASTPEGSLIVEGLSTQSPVVVPPPTPEPEPTGDPLFALVELLLHFDEVPNSGSQVLDSSAKARVPITESGALNSSQIAFGASAYTGGNIVYPKAGGLPDIISTNQFCCEMWVFLDTAANTGAFPFLLNLSNTSTTGFLFALLPVSGEHVLYVQKPSTDLQSPIPIPTGEWVHVAITRDAGNDIRIFQNGQVVDTQNDTTDFTGNSLFTLGPYNGLFVDEVRVTVGNARYTANFTPPTGPFPDSE